MVENAEATEAVTSGENSTKGMSRAVKDLRDAGNAHVAKGAWSRAINCYNKAIELDGNSAPLYSNRAAAEYLNQTYDKAFDDSLKAISIDPTWWKGYKWKGLSLIKLKRWVEAVEVLEKACEQFSDVAELKENLETARNELEHAQNLLYVLPGPEMMKKLDGIPVFIVTDEQGQPFFITYEDGQQVDAAGSCVLDSLSRN
uniref:Cns1/TTC4 wheel domain-containing protein n=1 Tax=Rhodosorus marinus TaxID=101924 RepID=A0A7S2ZY59_9RHOD|mmetsp:Transcript_33502/g.132161  ORF Transcript_33502/g.132161 Transcript_33502/m.132161 type:complete len:200 (+) Transcript_33502:362-961(+)